MSIFKVKEGISILAHEKGDNIKGKPLVDLVKKNSDLDVMVFTFSDENGSFMTIKDLLANFPNLLVVVLLFNRHYFKTGMSDGLKEKCGILSSISGRFSIYAVDMPAKSVLPRSSNKISARLLYGTGNRKQFEFTEAEWINTSRYGENAISFMNYANSNDMGWNLGKPIYKVMPFGFNDFAFIDLYADHFAEVLADSDIKNVFMVIGSGTTLVALYNAFRRVLSSNLSCILSSILSSDKIQNELRDKIQDKMPTFHCTVVGRAINEELIRLECPDIKVMFYEATIGQTLVEYHEELPLFPNDDFLHTHQLNYLIPMCPHYDSKLLIGLRKFLMQNGIHISDVGSEKIMLLFVMWIRKDNVASHVD